MDPAGPILALLSAASLGEVAHWAVFGYRAHREFRATPFVRDALALPAPAAWPTLSIVVPAHNEERVAAACARSILASDYPGLELLFVLDRCTDGTRALLEPIAAADPRLRIVDNASCPPDWAGKCNAARVGAQHARGELLLFTDADTTFDPALLRASVQLMRAREWRMLSLFSAPTHDHWFERIVQPVASLMLLKLFPISRANAGDGRRPFANGQFMLFERAAYDALGGHAAVKDDLLEDLAFARRMKHAKLGQGVAVSDGMLVVSMYDSWPAFQSGWRRIYIESCRRNPARLRRQAMEVLGGGVLLPALRTLALALAALVLLGAVGDPGDAGLRTAAWIAGALAAGAYLLRTLVLGAVYAAAGFPRWSILLYPAAAAAVARIFLAGARDLLARVPVRWGGRQYVLEPTDH
ncbi:MAG: glycosyltransferase family 2 protein [Phycisphaerales bacterium]